MGNEEKNPQPSPEDPSDKIFDTMFEFKSMAKSMSRESTKAESRSKALTEKVKKCIAKGDYEQAKIAANDAIREKNMIKRYRALSSKVDTIAQRLQSAYQNQRPHGIFRMSAQSFVRLLPSLTRNG